MDTYNETRSAISDVLEARDVARRNGSLPSDRGAWPGWGQLILAVLIVVVSVVLAYSALDKRISLMEQKLDYLVSHAASLVR